MAQTNVDAEDTQNLDLATNNGVGVWTNVFRKVRRDKKVAMRQLGSGRLIQNVDEVSKILRIRAFFFVPLIWHIEIFMSNLGRQETAATQWFYRLRQLPAAVRHFIKILLGSSSTAPASRIEENFLE